MIHLPDRFWAKVNKTGTCWLWLGAISGGGTGYGYFKIDGKVRCAHRLSFMALKGAIPQGTELDHLCRNTKCVNPKHLEAVSHAVNVLRGKGNGRKRWTHCHRGHEFSQENTRIDGAGFRQCRKCHKERNRENSI